MARQPIDYIGATGPKDGMGYSHPNGGYVQIDCISKSGGRFRFKISRGAAETLRDEIQGVLNRRQAVDG